jgi:ubiquinone/menaquinone biosynthesis C-methylase UbiE
MSQGVSMNRSDSGADSRIAETIARYDQIAHSFAAQWGKLRLDRALETFARLVPEPGRVLDLGCGPGRDLAFLTELGCRVIGLDASAGMLAEARGAFPSPGLVQADMRRLPFVTRCFDGVWACASLLHLPHGVLPLALAEISRVLGGAGSVLYLALKEGVGKRWVTDDQNRRSYFAYYQLSAIETALDLAGFQLVESWKAPDLSGRQEPWINAVAKVR